MTNTTQLQTREPLPDRPKGYSQKVKIGHQIVTLRTAEYDDGRLGEIAINVAKRGVLDIPLHDAAAMVSVGLQHGVPLEAFVEAATFTRSEHGGPVQGSATIKYCTSILDYVFRELAIHYLGRNDLAHVDPNESN